MKTKQITFIFILFLSVWMSPHIEAQTPGWALPAGVTFEYTCNVIASLELEDVPSNSTGDTIAFLKGNQVRGLGTSIALGNGQVLHFITLFSHQALDTFDIRAYHNATDQVYEVLHPFVFQSQQIIGDPDNPYLISLYPEANAPIYLTPVPSQSTIEGWPFVTINMNDYLIQPDGYPVDWSFISNPNLQVSFQGSHLQVQGAPGFVGTALLTVIATEVTPMAQMRDVAERSVPANEFTAETQISFEVNPLYAAPLWQPVIPHQGIVKGDTFDILALHDYENQFTGDSIVYSIQPEISEMVPPAPLPSWSASQSYPTNMTMICCPIFTPAYRFCHGNDRLAAFIDNEVRGVCQMNTTDSLFYLTIGGQINETDKITLKFYSGEMKKTWVIDSALYFQPYAIEGSATQPHLCEFSPLVPSVTDAMVAGGILQVEMQIRDTSFTGSMTFTFIAKDPFYPLYLNDSIDVDFCIGGDSSMISVWYADADGDGLGNTMAVSYACSQPIGYVTNDDDCNDNDPLNAGFEIGLTEDSGNPNDGFVCAGTSVTLTALINASSFAWSNGATGASIVINPAVSTHYTVTATYATGCSESKSDTIQVEGTMVTDSTNAGPGTLRSVVGCATEGSLITFDYPAIKSSLLTAPLLFDKDLTLLGWASDKPKIKLANGTINVFIHVLTGKKLGLENVDIFTPSGSSHPTFLGSGTIDILADTRIGHY